jgi:hypothetical protein
MSTKDARKSPRRARSVPVRVKGQDPDGNEFVEDASTLVVNWNGALLTTIRPLSGGQTLVMINRENSKEATFRVVGMRTDRMSEPGGLGVECLEPEEDIFDLGPVDASNSDA